eukprot:gb/GFBE01043402.1/.p1 GENE.gb/GFBE01043402.1/~~gb/GFBE01043402.1/.p1  ORF type:complete len:494 (+),score=113.73 gb/GFBE01043402.1/:1-1482(+)
MTMSEFKPPPRKTGLELPFEEVKRLVEKVAPKLKLEFDGNVGTGVPGPGQKGRYVVARSAIEAGEVILSERPLFYGSTDATKSQKVYTQAFLDSSEVEEEEEDFEDDCFHPRSPLVDCVAGVMLAKQLAADASSDKERREVASLSLRQLSSLSRTAVSDAMPRTVSEDLFSVLKPELQALTSEDELCGILHVLSSNRFGTSSSSMELMFAGSMFEHSCLPNCFVGTWRHPTAPDDLPQTYRALRDIAAGEAVSIDYLSLPGGYFPSVDRAKTLSGWGFACTCKRCTELPELERSFVCPACGAPELCPRRPGGGESELQCQSCGKTPEAEYAARCFAREASLNPDGPEDGKTVEGIAEKQTENDEGGEFGLLGRFHYLVFQALWANVAPGLPEDAEDIPPLREAVEALIAGVSRLYKSETHPSLLDLYHLGALLTQGNLEAQKSFLEREHAVLKRFYPEESERQDAEIMALVQGNGPLPASATDFASTALAEMD